MAIVLNFWLTIKLYKKNVSQLSHEIKNIRRSKLDQWYARAKMFVVYFGLHEPSLHSYRKEDQLDTPYGKKI